MHDDTRREGGERTPVPYPPHFLDIITGLLAAAGWRQTEAGGWWREKKVGRAFVRESLTLHSVDADTARALTGDYRYTIDSGTAYGIVYDEQESLPPVSLAAADPAQIANAVLALSARERRLLAARTAWIVGDAWPRLRELELFPGWIAPVVSPRWSVRWTAESDEWVVTTLDPNIEGEHPLLRYERNRGKGAAAARIAAGAIPLDPLSDVGGTFATFVMMVGVPLG